MCLVKDGNPTSMEILIGSDIVVKKDRVREIQFQKPASRDDNGKMAKCVITTFSFSKVRRSQKIHIRCKF